MIQPECFKPEPFLQAAEMLLSCDDTLLALELLNMMPAYFKDHPIKEIQDLKHEIMSKIATPTFYAQDVGCEIGIADETVLQYKTLRNFLIEQDVTRLNDQKMIPHIYDHGPGEGALPLILRSKGLKFTYEQIYLNEPTRQATKHRFEGLEKTWLGYNKDVPAIWVSTEIIEHLHCEDEIRFEMEQRCKPDIIHISTPLYTFNPYVKSWREIGTLGHLRTYSPNSFRQVVYSMFPDYISSYYQSVIQHIRLVNPNSKFEPIKTHYEVNSD